MAKEEKEEEKEDKHKSNLADFEDMPEDEAYYMALYREAFESGAGASAGPEEATTPSTRKGPMTLEEKLDFAYTFIDQARDRGLEVVYDHFKTITQFSSIFDEEGRSILDKNKYFHHDENGKIRTEEFDEMIRDPVYKALKYRGSFRTMITSKYFIDPQQKNEFFYNASQKVPFYLIYECSPQI